MYRFSRPAGEYRQSREVENLAAPADGSVSPSINVMSFKIIETLMISLLQDSHINSADVIRTCVEYDSFSGPVKYRMRIHPPFL